MFYYSVIIPTYKRPISLKNTLDSIFNNCNYLNKIEIIVVDNDKEGSAKNISDKFNVKYFIEEQIGVSFARNRGAKESLSNKLVFFDDDELITFNWFNEVLKHLDKDFIAGQIELFYEEGKPFWIHPRLEYYLSKIDYKKNKILKDIEWISSGNILVSKNIFNEVGGFSYKSQRTGKNFLGNEDIILKKEFEIRNIPIYYIHEMKVIHCIPLERTTEEWFLKRAKGQGASNVSFDVLFGLSRLNKIKLSKYLIEKLLLFKLFFPRKYRKLLEIVLSSKIEYLSNYKK